MKVLLLLTICIASFSASAQVMDKETFQKRVEEFNKKYKNNRMPNGIISLVKPELRSNQDLSIPLTARTSRVQSLPLDGMPCIVPDVTEIAAMPNAATKVEVFKSAIPNAVPVQPVLPDVPKK